MSPAASRPTPIPTPASQPVRKLAWAATTAGGELAGSNLEVSRIPIRVRCRACGAESQPEDPAILTCRSCGAVRPEVLEGSGIVLRSLEVEEER